MLNNRQDTSSFQAPAPPPSQGIAAARRGQYRFSDHFGISKPQSQLDFVDIPLDTDVSLYVDPYALSVSPNDWLRECGNVVVNFFEDFLAAIRDGDEGKVMSLISNLHEPNDAHLGLSLGRPAGRGWGGKQGHLLLLTLKNSTAVRSGRLRDLSDIELLMPGIGSDKISDLTLNVIRGELVAYTEEQCRLYNVPTERINSGLYWDYENKRWASRYADLPVYQDRRIVLVPKAAVRARLVPSYEEFYSRFVLDFLSAEHLKANDSLVTLLKNGTGRVYKSDLKNRYPLSKEFLFKFTQEHPEVLQAYKETLPEKAKPIEALDIESRQQVPRPATSDPDTGLERLPAGRECAGRYHTAILGLLTEIFYPSLTHPVKEQEVDDGRKRIDILFSNSAEEGFFSRLVHSHKIHCPYVSVECKNYTEDPQNPELDQLMGRFSRKRGRFGILVCRNIHDPQVLLKRLQDVVNNTEGVIIVLDDADITALHKLKRLGKRSELNEHLEAKLRPILM
ncbi:MAG TPA: hypothetical protein VNZ03_27735 [Terriglobales bacterium]|nr:hypothetical protein [Terriglobales bacterium]